MAEEKSLGRPDWGQSTDVALDAAARAGSEMAVRELTRRHNQRLYRAAYAILKDRADAEEVVQDAFLRALCGAAYTGDAAYGTWLTRIAINLSLDRKRRAARRTRLFGALGVIDLSDRRVRLAEAPESLEAPDVRVGRAQLAQRLEAAVARLPEKYRAVFVLREIEEMSVGETAAALSLGPQTVKVRLMRAKRRLQQDLEPDLRLALNSVFPFAGARCARLTERVLQRLAMSFKGG